MADNKPYIGSFSLHRAFEQKIHCTIDCIVDFEGADILNIAPGSQVYAAATFILESVFETWLDSQQNKMEYSYNSAQNTAMNAGLLSQKRKSQDNSMVYGHNDINGNSFLPFQVGERKEIIARRHFNCHVWGYL